MKSSRSPESFVRVSVNRLRRSVTSGVVSTALPAAPGSVVFVCRIPAASAW